MVIKIHVQIIIGHLYLRNAAYAQLLHFFTTSKWLVCFRNDNNNYAIINHSHNLCMLDSTILNTQVVTKIGRIERLE